MDDGRWAYSVWDYQNNEMLSGEATDLGNAQDAVELWDAAVVESGDDPSREWVDQRRAEPGLPLGAVEKGTPDQAGCLAMAETSEQDPESSRALDRASTPAERIAVMRAILRRNTGAGKALLLEVGSDPTEAREMLELVGQQLARLMWADAVSEFDTRNLTDIVGSIIVQWTPDELGPS